LLAVIDPGAAPTEECEADTAAGITVTAGFWSIAVPLTVAVMVFPSALVELNVELETPLELVFAAAVNELPVPVDDIATVAFPTGLLNWSTAVMVIRDARLAPVVHEDWHAESVVCSVVTEDRLAETAAGFTVTLAVWVIGTPLMVAETVLPSALVELSVPVATPLEFVLPAGCVSVLPVVGFAARTTPAF
jgi:hypothetical protein